jgi:hypothetical protein
MQTGITGLFRSFLIVYQETSLLHQDYDQEFDLFLD